MKHICFSETRLCAAELSIGSERNRCPPDVMVAPPLLSWCPLDVRPSLPIPGLGCFGASVGSEDWLLGGSKLDPALESGAGVRNQSMCLSVGMRCPNKSAGHFVLLHQDIWWCQGWVGLVFISPL